jgi:hypothetical protein
MCELKPEQVTKPKTEEIVGLLRDIRTAVEQIEAGNGVPNREAKAELRRRFGPVKDLGRASDPPLC